MPGLFKIAKFSILEIMMGKVFKVIVVIGLISMILICFFGYRTVDKYSDEMGLHEAAEELQHAESSNPLFAATEAKDQIVYAQIETLIRWFAYVGYIFLGNILVIFSAIGILAPELDKRSIYTLISKPVSRMSILFGKLLGVYGAMVGYMLIMLISATLLCLVAGAGFQKELYPAFAIGFFNFMIFGAFAMLLSIRMKQILVAVLTVVILWGSTYFSMLTMESISVQIFKVDKKKIDYVLLVLPHQRNIGSYALSYIVDEYVLDMMDEIDDPDFAPLKMISDDPKKLIQPLVWYLCVLSLNFLWFRRKEFD